MPRDWDAATYDRIADPQTRWGRAVLNRLPLAGDERVLDAGCGTGRVTELLLARLPRGRVVALDGSPAMIAEARRRLGEGDERVDGAGLGPAQSSAEGFEDPARVPIAKPVDGAGLGPAQSMAKRVEYVVADLAQPLPLREPVDAVFSTATFHWISDHDALFRHLAAVLRAGGRLCAQCGGHGNVASVRAAVHAIDPSLGWRKNFATPEETEQRLARAGFVDVRAWLQPEPTRFAPGEPLETFLRTVILGEVLEQVAPERRDAFVREVAARLPRPEIDYVRLNIDARRAPS
jgi:trans-aconitate 2-methyltransferase